MGHLSVENTRHLDKFMWLLRENKREKNILAALSGVIDNEFHNSQHDEHFKC